MTEKTGGHPKLTFALSVVVFLALALLGSYLILGLPINVPTGVLPNVGHSGSYGLAFFIDGTLPENQYQRLYAQNGSFSGIWQYSAASDVPGNVSGLFLALVDYNLTPLSYNGSLESSHRFNFPMPFRNNVSFELTGIQDGFHDVTLIAIRNPYADPAENPAYYDRNGIDGSGMRFTVISGNATKPEPRYGAGPLEEYVTYRNGTGKNLFGYGPWLTEEPLLDLYDIYNRPTGNEITTIDAAPGQEIDYYINVKNAVGQDNKQFDRFALLQLLDYGQTPIRQDTPGYVYYGTLDPDGYAAVHASIIAPAAPGTHVLILVLAANPYDDYSEEIWILSTRVTPVIINVKG